MKSKFWMIVCLFACGDSSVEYEEIGQTEQGIRIGIDYLGGVNIEDPDHGQCVYEGEICVFPAPNPQSFYDEKRRATSDSTTGWAGELTKNTAREYADSMWSGATGFEFFPTQCASGVECLQIVFVNNENISGNLGTGNSIFVRDVLHPECVLYDHLVEEGVNITAVACRRWELQVDVGSFNAWLGASSATVKQNMMNQLYAFGYGIAIGHGATNVWGVDGNNVMHYKLYKNDVRDWVHFTQICSSYQLWLRGSVGKAVFYTGPRC